MHQKTRRVLEEVYDTELQKVEIIPVRSGVRRTRGVTMRALDTAEVAEVTGGEDRTGFVPGWYYRRGRADQ